MSKVVDIINQFIIDNDLVDARMCEGEFKGLHSRLTVGGANPVVGQIEELIKEAYKKGLVKGIEDLNKEQD